jgi:hypothetical protein
MQGLACCVLFKFFASEDEKLRGTKLKFESQTREAQGSAKIPPKGSRSFADLCVVAKATTHKERMAEGSPTRLRARRIRHPTRVEELRLELVVWNYSPRRQVNLKYNPERLGHPPKGFILRMDPGIARR